jgi:hypothetical protein
MLAIDAMNSGLQIISPAWYIGLNLYFLFC